MKNALDLTFKKFIGICFFHKLDTIESGRGHREIMYTENNGKKGVYQID